MTPESTPMTSDEEAFLDAINTLRDLRRKNPEFAELERTDRQLHELSECAGESGTSPAEPPATLLARAKEIDRMSADTPTTPRPVPTRRWRRVSAVAGGLAASLVLVWFAFLRGGHIEDKPPIPYDPWPKQQQLVAWEGTGLPPAPEKLTADTGVQFVSLDITSAHGDRAKETAAQALFADRVAAAGKREQFVVIDGKRHELPDPQNPKIVPNPVPAGYRLNGGQFETYTYESYVVARQIEETLFAVGGLDVYPGIPFPAAPYLKTGEVESWYRGKKNLKPAPLRLTAYGCPRTAGPDGKAEKLIDGDQMPELKDPSSRESYERVLAQLKGQVGHAGMWNEVTQTAFGKAHLGLQASLSVKGGWGNVDASFSTDESEEKGAVFMLLSQESFRVAVDKAPPAGEWLDQSMSADQVPEVAEPLMYVSEVVYGRCILVVAQSSLTTSEQKAALGGKAETIYATIEGSAKLQKQQQLNTTTVKVLNWGGMAKPKESYSIEEFRKLLTDLKSAELTPQSAVPIAFKARWLGDHKPAAWVGVTPLRTYKVEKKSVTFDMVLEEYQVNDTYAKVVIFGKDGDLVVAVNDKSGWNDQLAVKSGPKPSRGTGLHRPNTRFYDRAAVPGDVFTVLVRQGEHDDINAWNNMDKNGDAFSEKPIVINVADLLKKSDRSERYSVTLGKGDRNTATFRVTVHAPNIPELTVPPMVNATAGDTAVKK